MQMIQTSLSYRQAWCMDARMNAHDEYSMSGRDDIRRGT